MGTVTIFPHRTLRDIVYPWHDKHIFESHLQDFANKGISEVNIPYAIKRVLKDNKVVGSAPDGSLIYEILVNGIKVTIRIVVSTNGYIVNAFPNNL